MNDVEPCRPARGQHGGDQAEDDAGYRPSELTRGPWDEASQHAGPPAALLGHALESLPLPGDTPMRVGRVTYEILRPVPIIPLRVEARVARDGRRVQMLSASLHAGDEEVMRARGWRLREEPLELPPGLVPGPPGHGPEDGESGEFFPTGSEVGYHTAVEYRFVSGRFVEPGPATVWMRSRVAIVAGEELSPLQRVLVVADSGNGVSATLDWREFLFINVDLTVHLQPWSDYRLRGARVSQLPTRVEALCGKQVPADLPERSPGRLSCRRRAREARGVQQRGL